MKHPPLLLLVFALVGCGDDASPADSGRFDSGDVDSGATDSGGTDGGVDTGASDSGATDGSDTGPALGPGGRFRTAQTEGRMVVCACLVDAGEFVDLDACMASMPLVTDTQVECIDAALAGEPGQTLIFNCKTDALQSLNTCNASVSCAELMAGTGVAVACRMAFGATSAACGDIMPAIANEILDCTPAM